MTCARLDTRAPAEGRASWPPRRTFLSVALQGFCASAKPSAWLGLALLAASACNDSTQAQELSSLERSGDVAFVCRDVLSGEGRPLAACPDVSDDDGEKRHLLALVTQTLRGEVALVDFTDGDVVDVDPTLPGPSFLPVGAQPVDIVSTPGGLASFVGVAEPGKEGIFALPTVCLDAPSSDEPIRDVTSWPACALPGAPGELAVIVQAGASQLGDACDGSAVAAPTGAYCSADLAEEESVAPAGRRKLAITVPELGALAIIDAQTILNREAGSFEACAIERWIPLSSRWQAETIEQPIPEAWQQPGVGQPLYHDESTSQCQVASSIQYTEPRESGAARPTGMAAFDDKLYIADRGAPVIHVVDVADVCAPRELPPLVVVSYEHPTRAVATRDVAVSPRTSAGRQFLYAVDDTDGSLLTYDISPDVQSRVPLLRPHAPLFPTEPPDRLVFSAPIQDLSTFQRDVPASDPDSGIALLDVGCDPDPNARPPATLYRTSDDHAEGARPAKLRGVFLAAALANGEVAFVDVEDYDAACRRPSAVNHAATPNVLGCMGDDSSIDGYLDSRGFPTVSNEASCNVVEPNELRSGAFFVNDSDVGVRAPTLRYFPRLSDLDGLLRSAGDDEERIHPRMLGVPFTERGGAATSTLYVGTTLYSTDQNSDDPLSLGPGSASENSVLFPLVDPRAYATSERFAVTFEGALAVASTTGRLDREAGRFTDNNAAYCDMGVQDVAAATSWADELGIDEGKRATFARTHSDFLQFSADFDEDDDYWASPRGRSCVRGLGRDGCEILFGPWDEPRPARELSIIEAYQDHLVVEPRWSVDRFSPAEVMEELNCCFASVSEYVVRGANQWILRGTHRGFQHRAIEGQDGRCVSSCDPARARNDSRIIEISTGAECPAEEGGRCLIGAATPEDVACVTDVDGDQVSLANDTLPIACIHDGSVSRFAVFRGRQPSKRDMSFSWEVSGGFRSLRASIASSYSGASVLPQSIAHLEASDRLVVVDGSAGGLSLISLTSLALSPSKPYQ